MSTGAIDYAALAKQAGATSSTPPTVDYAALAKQAGAIGYQPPSTIKAAPSFGTAAWAKEKFYNAADAIGDFLPAAGATVGALAGLPGGVPGSVAGATLGGGAGEASRQLLRRSLGSEVPDTSGAAAMQIGKQAAIQGAVELGTAGLGRVAGPLKESALSQYTRALAPTTAKNKVIAQKIAPEMIDRGVRGSLDSIEQQAASTAQTLRPALDASYAAMPASATAGSGTQILAALDTLKQRYIVNGQVARPEAVKAIEGVQDIVRQYGPDIDPQALRKLKGIFDDPVASAGGFAGTDLTTKYALRADKTAANEIRNIVHGAAGDVAVLDKNINFWLDVKKVAGASALRQAGQQGGLLKTLAPLGAGVAGGLGFAAQGAAASAEAAALSAMAGATAYAMRTAQWRTTSAILKDRLANALTNGNVREGVAIFARLGIAVPAAMEDYGKQVRTAPPSQSPRAALEGNP